MKNYKSIIIKEIELTEDTILSTVWNKSNYDTLIKLIKMLEELKTTLKYIKAMDRNLM